MTLRRSRVVVLLVCVVWLPAAARPQEKQPEPTGPKEFDQATVKALEQHRFQAGWVYTFFSIGQFWTENQRKHTPVNLDEIPGVIYLWQKGHKPDFQALKSVKVPFGLDLVRWHRDEKEKQSGVGTHLAGIDRLTHLRVPGNTVSSADLESLAQLKGLTHLDISGIWDKDIELKHIAKLKNLTHLTLHSTRDREFRGDPALVPQPSPYGVTDEELRHLAGLENLTLLDLGSASVSDAGLKHLAGLRNLKHFSLFNGSSGVSDEGLKQLANSKNLTHLHLFSLRLSSAGLKHLSDHPTLTYLILNVNPTDQGAEQIGTLQKLTYLELREARLSAKGIQHIAGLGNLTELHLPSTKVNDEGVKHIAGLKNLRRLTVNIDGVTVAGVKHFANLDKLTDLRVLCNTLEKKAVVDELTKVRPKNCSRQIQLRN